MRSGQVRGQEMERYENRWDGLKSEGKRREEKRREEKRREEKRREEKRREEIKSREEPGETKLRREIA